MTFPVFLGGILTALGVWQIYRAVKNILNSPLFKKHAVLAAGKITDYEKELAPYPNHFNKFYVYYPTITYIANEKEVTFTSRHVNFFKPKIGKRVKIKFDPQNPENVDIFISFFNILTAIQILSGIILVFIGGLLIFILKDPGCN